MAPRFISIIPVDLRWGVLAEESKSCFDIQKTCLNQVDNCRMKDKYTPWLLALRTDRYGWVQGDNMASEGFEKPGLYKWLDKLQETRKRLSITSLEVCHATQLLGVNARYPTVFCYGRKFTHEAKTILKNDKMRWVFDFEYTSEDVVDPDLKYQYSKTDNADEYQNDRDSLNRYLKDIPHVIYHDFPASFSPGDAKFTCKRENAKSFGVGYTCGLGEFKAMVEKDLIRAIEMNFVSADTDNVDKYELETIQHEIDIKVKASTFVGRKEMRRAIKNHLTKNSDDTNVMILHGEPGCGKSGLLAAAAKDAIRTRKDGNFIFVHAVDSCPGSSSLEGFLRRLRSNLAVWRREQGEVRVDPTPPDSVSELKQTHHEFVAEAGSSHEKRIIIIVDAVNQFRPNLRAWDMWWLWRDAYPSNVRILISTLNTENNTFTNAKDACSRHTCLEVADMSRADLVEMISGTLARYNKKLTDYDDKLLGNQMELLLSKSSSPLFLIASCEALRRFGIFEKVSQYIKSLPEEISSLFGFLIDEWSKEYGKMFVEDVCGLIALSKDGLLENEINSLLAYKEEKEKPPSEEFLYESSFSRIYDSIASFLAAGGGGFLRFFHDQLKYTVRNKFLDDEFKLKTHTWMRDFFLSVITPQYAEGEKEAPPDFYHHALQQVVYHQFQAVEDGDYSCLKNTLRNVQFIRERIKAQQQNSLNEEYIKAIDEVPDEDALYLKDWAKFVQLYSQNILEFPNLAYNMAMNQAPSSQVTKDTLALGLPEEASNWYVWANIPKADDPMAVKYGSRGVDICASSPKNDLVAIAGAEEGVICDQSSGEVLHKFDVQAYSVYLTHDAEKVFFGLSDGTVACYDTESGTILMEGISLEGTICWIGESVEGHLSAGTAHARKAICWDDYDDDDKVVTFSVDDLSVKKSWSAEGPCFLHCYSRPTNTIFSALKGTVSGWDPLTGVKTYDHVTGGGCTYSVAAHPSERRILAGSNDLIVSEWEVPETGPDLIAIREVTLPLLSGWFFGGIWSCVYSHSGDEIFATEPHSEAIHIINKDSVNEAQLKGHADCINKISLVPGSNQIISVDRGSASIMWNLPTDNFASTKQSVDEKVISLAFNLTEDKFYTASKSHLRIWDVETMELEESVQFNGFYKSMVAVHPDGEHIISNTRMNMLVYTISLEFVADYQILESSDGSITDMKISSDGSRVIITECRNQHSELSKFYIWDCHEPLDACAHFVLDPSNYGGRMFSCCISSDGQYGLIGGHAAGRIIDIDSGEILRTINNGCFLSRFMPNSSNFFVEDGEKLMYMDIEGNELGVLTGHSDTIQDVAVVDNFVFTVAEDGEIRKYGINTFECVYGFFNHRCQQFKALASTKSGSCIIAANSNNMVYVLKKCNA